MNGLDSGNEFIAAAIAIGVSVGGAIATVITKLLGIYERFSEKQKFNTNAETYMKDFRISHSELGGKIDELHRNMLENKNSFQSIVQSSAESVINGRTIISELKRLNENIQEFCDRE